MIPLFELLVREKCDTRDSIYLIIQNKKNPEMYEMVCNTSNERQKWILILQRAAANCPADSNDGMILLKSRINYLTLTIFVLSADSFCKNPTNDDVKLHVQYNCHT